jgi:hypothetical protein
VKASKVRRRFAKCMCHHPVTKPGGKGHNMVGGQVTRCYFPHCGCGIYRPQDERLMKRS